MQRTRFAALTVWGLSLLAAHQAWAIPGFARKYSPNTSVFTFMPCQSCHATYPKLTPFGREYKENGYRIVGEPASWKEALRQYPMALRSSLVNVNLGPGNGCTTPL